MLLIINQKIQIQRLVFFKCTVKWRKLIKNDYGNNNKTQHKKYKIVDDFPHAQCDVKRSICSILQR